MDPAFRLAHHKFGNVEGICNGLACIRMGVDGIAQDAGDCRGCESVALGSGIVFLGRLCVLGHGLFLFVGLLASSVAEHTARRWGRFGLWQQSRHGGQGGQKRRGVRPHKWQTTAKPKIFQTG